MGRYIRRTSTCASSPTRLSDNAGKSVSDVVRRNAATERVATLLCRLMMEGLAPVEPSDTELGHPRRVSCADGGHPEWTNEVDPTIKPPHPRVARAEFGRRGYAGTTVRDIAAAAGIGPRHRFRLIGIEDELLSSIMGTFGEEDEGSREVLRSKSSPIEKLTH